MNRQLRGGLHVTVQNEHLLPAIFQKLFAEVVNEPANGDSGSRAVLGGDGELVFSFIREEHFESTAGHAVSISCPHGRPAR